MSWRPFLKVFISLLLLFPIEQWVYACSDSADPYDYYPSFFQPSVLGAPQFQRYFYTAYAHYYDDWYAVKGDEEMPDVNLREWSMYSGGTVTPADLDSFIYSYAREHLSNLYYHLEKAAPLNLPARVLNNGFTSWFRERKDLEALGYLMYAKQCQPFVSSDDAWDADGGRDTAKMGKLIRSGVQLHAAAKKDFFKWRYAFQVLRLSLYAGQPERTLALYESLTGDKTDKGIMYPRCLGLKAGALFALNRRDEAAYLYSLVFDRSDEMKRTAGQSFAWSTTEQVTPVLSLCRTPHEKAVVHILDALHEYEYALPKIQAAYELDNAVAGIDVVMVREINKLEERYQQDVLLKERNISAGPNWYSRYEREIGYENDDNKKGAAWLRYADALQRFAQTNADNPATQRKAFWNLCIAYIQFVKGDAGATAAALAKAGNSVMAPREQALFDLISVLSIVRNSKGMTAETEGRILPVLQRLEYRSQKSPEAAKTLRDLTGTVLATAYLRAGDSVKALYAIGKNADRGAHGYAWDTGFEDLPGMVLNFMSVDALHRVQGFARSGGKTPYEKWLLDGSPYTAPVLQELEGTKELREHHFARAAEVLQTAKPGSDEAWILPDPFRADIREVVWELDAKDSSGMMTKLEFAKEMARLDDKVKSKTADYKALFDYATGMYGMTYYGKAYHAHAYYRSSVDGNGYYDSRERRALPAWKLDYYTAASAEKAYLAALEKAPDAEAKARTLFMLAKCWQKRSPEPETGKSPWNDDYGERYAANALLSPYLKRLHTEYAGTAFYKEAATTCNYLGSYAKRTR